ncbi:MAG: polymer-forming cytoskeletal protein [Oscillospiraceae bacterium]|nr:polymer-forming cytoskeletal protein [Oscillospiraceae bacterium]MDE6996933.1 polymer-forming cytoskeletal protein [Oscillospiraceae bacterium]
MALFGRKHVEEEEDVLDTSASVSQEDLPDLPEPPSSTVVASGTSITGTMKGEGIIQVEGVVEGEIDLKGAVIVAPSGLVSGPVTADVIRIAGRVEGVVSARDHLFIEKTGSLQGDFTTVSLVVEDGGRLNGTASMPAKNGAK